MKNISLGFIGGGRITGIFLQGFANKNVEFQSVVVYDTNSETVGNLKLLFPQIMVAENLEQVASQSVVFIALHPPVIMETLGKMAELVTKDTIFISLAPKITIEKIVSKLQATNIARLIPNATSYINEGYNPVCFSAEFDLTTKKLIFEILKVLGNTFEVAEPKLEGYAILSAMLPTYFWFQWEELVKIGEKMGLSEQESKESVFQTLLSAMHLMFQSELPYDKVIDLIPVKPIGDSQTQIIEIYQSKLMGLFEKIRP